MNDFAHKEYVVKGYQIARNWIRINIRDEYDFFILCSFNLLEQSLSADFWKITRILSNP